MSSKQNTRQTFSFLIVTKKESSTAPLIETDKNGGFIIPVNAVYKGEDCWLFDGDENTIGIVGPALTSKGISFKSDTTNYDIFNKAFSPVILD